MSMVTRQHTCAACGGPFEPGELTDLEPLLDDSIRYVAVHAGHTTHPLRCSQHEQEGAS